MTGISNEETLGGEAHVNMGAETHDDASSQRNAKDCWQHWRDQKQLKDPSGSLVV